ncbi:hypothetical protein PR202_ga19257 [Eleusine coracana subsp. coracana]|uniref:DNA2/NAM7 helicase helicase domain-containing protein n=1 Tax=Eleusine coracana subsp. coracana TaxID=191504 RepID=A0AAV5CU18_ELECO|nr:hypothetical protein PR202_ga19257 [Eleusine coracana subsp. coracana]
MLCLSQANTIPNRFFGLKSYLDSFRIPLLEQMRAEMSSNLESLSNHSSTMPIRSLIPRGKGVVKNSLHYSVTVARRRGACSPCIGDIIMLTDAMPRRPGELASSGRSYCLAHVKNVNARDKFSFEVRASKKIKDFDCYAFAVSLLSFIPYVRIWRCLDHDTAVKKNPALVKAIAGDAQISTTANALLICISFILIIQLNADHIQTTSKCRILTCAPTNTAISQVAARVMALRSQRPAAAAAAGGGGCVGDLLLFGNKERMPIRGDLAEIFLDTCAKRLKQSFSPATGWRHCLVSLEAFLGGPRTVMCQYNEAVQDRWQKDGTRLPELTLIRSRFNQIFQTLRSCFATIMAHVPKTRILEKNYKSIVSLTNMLQDFSKLLATAFAGNDVAVVAFTRDKK